MSDPTYDRKDIDWNPVWQLAFSLSEIQNDNAPIGWSRYIYVAECLLNNYEIKRKPTAAAPPPAPAQEPVAWRYKERINCGQGQFIDSDWKLLPFRPILGGSSDGGCTSGITHLEPLYAAPPPDEARDK